MLLSTNVNMFMRLDLVSMIKNPATQQDIAVTREHAIMEWITSEVGDKVVGVSRYCKTV